VKQHREEQNLEKKGKKIAITSYSLDHWWAQSFGLDINNMPRYPRGNIPKAVFTDLFFKYKHNKHDPNILHFENKEGEDEEDTYPPAAGDDCGPEQKIK